MIYFCVFMYVMCGIGSAMYVHEQKNETGYLVAAFVFWPSIMVAVIFEKLDQ